MTHSGPEFFRAQIEQYNCTQTNIAWKPFFDVIAHQIGGVKGGGSSPINSCREYVKVHALGKPFFPDR